MSGELTEHRVAIVVFTTVLAADEGDAASVAETGIRQAIGTTAINDPDHLTIGCRFANASPAKVHIHRISEVGNAMANRHLTSAVTYEAYRGER